MIGRVRRLPRKGPKMDYPFPFPNAQMFPFQNFPSPMMMNPWMMMPGQFPGAGMMPTQEQREEMSIQFLTQQKEQIAQTRKYFEEMLKSLDESVAAIDKELEKVSAGRAQREKTTGTSSKSK